MMYKLGALNFELKVIWLKAFPSQSYFKFLSAPREDVLEFQQPDLTFYCSSVYY